VRIETDAHASEQPDLGMPPNSAANPLK
jgi:hypothetical protein